MLELARTWYTLRSTVIFLKASFFSEGIELLSIRCTSPVACMRLGFRAAACWVTGSLLGFEDWLSGCRARCCDVPERVGWFR